MPTASVRFVYVPCQDLDTMRNFYTDLIELDEIYFSPQERMLAYNCDGLQFTIMESETATPLGERWAIQPGWPGGVATEPSWSIVVPLEAFIRTVDRLIESDVSCRNDEPDWVGYWSFPVRDPMGTTVEITCAPDTPPTEVSWAAQVQLSAQNS